MKHLQWQENQASAVLGAMHMVTTLGETQEANPLTEDLLRSLRDHVFHSKTDLSALPRLTPKELAQQVSATDERKQAVQFLVLVPYLPVLLDPRQVELVDQYAAALEVSPTTLKDLHMVRDKRLKRLAFDYSRRSIQEVVPGSPLEKLHQIARAVHQYVGDETVAEKYRALENFPDESLGKTFYRFYRDRNFPLPGEKGSFSELAVTHDMTHILSGRNTSMAGEINVAGVEAGMSRAELGWELLLEVILDFHLGLAFTTAGLLPPGVGHFDPEGVAQGFELGSQMNIDLIADWDPWTVMNEPVEKLRERYSIKGVQGIYLPPPPPDLETAAGGV